MDDESTRGLVFVLVAMAIPLAALLATVIGAVVLGHFARLVVRTGRARDLLAPSAFAGVGATMLGAATLVFYYGWFLHVPWFDIDDFCPHDHVWETTEAPFRLSATCSSGTLVEQYVPGWVNPATVVLTVCGALGLLGYVVTRASGRRSPRFFRQPLV